MEDKNLKKGDKIKISYNATINEVNRDEGEYYSENDEFIILLVNVFNNDLKKYEIKPKHISKNKIIRIEVI